MGTVFPTKMLFRLGELQTNQGYGLDEDDYTIPGVKLLRNPISVIDFEDNCPEHIERETTPSISGSAIKDVVTRAPRQMRLKLGVHAGRDDFANKTKISGRSAYDALQYWLYQNLQEAKMHIWDTRYVKYFVGEQKCQFIPGMSHDNMEVDCSLFGADPFVYSTVNEGGRHPWLYDNISDLEWAGTTSGRNAGDEVAYPLMSIKNTHSTRTWTTGYKLTHLGLQRDIVCTVHIAPGQTHLLELGRVRGWLDGQAVTIGIGGVPLWLRPDGINDEFRIQQLFPQSVGTRPPEDNIVILFSWVPRYQI